MLQPANGGVHGWKPACAATGFARTFGLMLRRDGRQHLFDLQYQRTARILRWGPFWPQSVDQVSLGREVVVLWTMWLVGGLIALHTIAEQLVCLSFSVLLLLSA